jgi:hypothetical protein
MEVLFYFAMIIAIVIYVTGFWNGYKTKESRINWMRRRRDGLASRLEETQRMLEGITTI